MRFFRKLLKRHDSEEPNEETIRAFEEADAAQRGEIELEEGYYPEPCFLFNPKNAKEYSHRIVPTSAFKTDLNRMVKRGADLSDLQRVLDILGNGGILPMKYKDHPLKGRCIGKRECHINPDWLLIYRVDRKKLTLYEIRTGTHSDLFKE